MPIPKDKLVGIGFQFIQEREEKENLTNISSRLKYQGTQVRQSDEYIICKWNKLTPVFVKRFGFDR